MKKLQQCLAPVVLGILGAVYCASAQDSITNQSNTTPDLPFYRAHELSIDVFGSGSIRQQTIDNITGDKIEHNGRLGAGAGLNYFFCRHVGVGADAYTENTAHNFVDSASGNLIGRLPIAQTGIAPYIFGGGGYQFDEVDQKFAQCGAGIELRFAKHIGLFLDARYVFADKTEDYGVGRAGLRFSF